MLLVTINTTLNSTHMHTIYVFLFIYAHSFSFLRRRFYWYWLRLFFFSRLILPSSFLPFMHSIQLGGKLLPAIRGTRDTGNLQQAHQSREKQENQGHRWCQLHVIAEPSSVVRFQTKLKKSYHFPGGDYKVFWREIWSPLQRPPTNRKLNILQYLYHNTCLLVTQITNARVFT
jgi:hypothetical protein